MRITLEPISQERFAPFGAVIAVGDAFGRTDYVATIENRRPHARANLAIVHLSPTALPASINEMERHVHSTQAFIPLDVERFGVIVAPDLDGRPDVAAARGFVVPAGVGISYLTGVWHTAMMVFDRPGTLAILVHEDGTVQDCSFVTVDPFEVVV